MACSSEVQATINRDFPPQSHPYRVFEQTLLEHVEPHGCVLDIGCGRRAPNLVKLKGRARTLMGIDIVDFEISEPDLILLNGSVCDMSRIATGSVDLAYSRSVMEHLEDVRSTYSEVCRILKPSGKYLFLTPNFLDYVSLVAYAVPNPLHGKLVRFTEGRAESETFPTYYKSNTYYGIKRLAQRSDLEIINFQYLGQYPSSFLFNETLFSVAGRYEKFLERHSSLHFLRGWILCVLRRTGDQATGSSQ